MEKITKRDRQTVHFLKWIKRYSGWWFLICTPNDEHMNIGMMKLLIERLEKEQFYDIIFVLLMVHRNEPFMKNIFEYLLLQIITENWNGNAISGKQVIREIIQLLN